MNAETYNQFVASYVLERQNDILYLQKAIAPKFESIEISCKDISDDFTEWTTRLLDKGVDDKCSVLYYITFENVDASEIIKKADKAKKGTKKIALPQINYTSTSQVLYVGKTNTKFPSRLKYHLGMAPGKTYALHLKYWAKDYHFTLHVAKMCFEPESQKFLEQLESALHFNLKPILGRSGH